LTENGFLANPGVRDGSFIAFLGSHDIEMKGGEVFQKEVCFSDGSQVNRFDVLMTLIAKVDAMRFFFFSIKKLKRFLIPVVAEGADHSVDSPLISAMRTEEVSFSNLLLQQT
jgi:hypothetical protein